MSERARSKKVACVLVHGNKGRPLILSDFDKRVQQYLRNLRLAGSVVNRTVAVAEQ